MRSTPVTPTLPPQPSEPVPPVAEHTVAPTVAHVRVVDPPVVTVAGAAVNAEMTGRGGGVLVTFNTTELGELAPPGPVQLSV